MLSSINYEITDKGLALTDEYGNDLGIIRREYNVDKYGPWVVEMHPHKMAFERLEAAKYHALAVAIENS